ncbi:MAG TPA: D-aminoacylase [Verrucomicrobiae bacterium]|nr:D-aminoacylase [Verrucomicrobiae bacterium]
MKAVGCRRSVPLVALLAFAGLAGSIHAAATPAAPVDLILRGGRVVDGTGNPWFKADVAITGDRIVAMGRLDGRKAKRVIDVSGLVVAPGFIDMLGQSEYTVLVDPQVLSKTTQGITTELTGEGGSVGPMSDYSRGEAQAQVRDLGLTIDWRDHAGYFKAVARKGTALNFAHMVGAAQVRENVLQGADRDPTPAEIETMKQRVAQAMEQGCWGLSTSLIYPPGAFAKTDELVALATVAAKQGGFYATHMRTEGEKVLDAIDEAATIGERAGCPVEIWHLKASGRTNWGRMPELLQHIDSIRDRGIDMTADIYPYPAAMTGLAASLPPEASEGGLQALLKRLADPAGRAKLRRQLETPGEGFERLFNASGGAEGILIMGVKTPANRAVQGKRLSEIAALRHVDAIDAMFDLLLEEGGTIDTVYFVMSEDDVRKALVAPYVSFDCDAAGVRPDGTLGASLTHPRAYGSFPRVLGRYVRDQHALGLEEAVRKMTSLPAHRIGLVDRGLVRQGLFADLTIFDPAKVIDRATFEAPQQLSDGIVHVIVNGRPVIENGKATGATPGRILLGPGYRAPAKN